MRETARRAPGQTSTRGDSWQGPPRNRRGKPRQQQHFCTLLDGAFRRLAAFADRQAEWWARKASGLVFAIAVATAALAAGLATLALADVSCEPASAEIAGPEPARKVRDLFGSAHLDTTVDGDPEPENREGRLQRLLWQDAETASRLVPVICNLSESRDDGLVYDVALAVARSCRQHGLRPELVCALIRVESSYNPRCVSSTRDVGLCQLHEREIYDVQDNIEAGCAELSEWIGSAHGDERIGLCRYNGGGRGERIGQCRRYADRVLAIAGDGA